MAMLNVLVSCALGNDTFLLGRMSGQDELGRLSIYQLELLSERADVQAEQLLGTELSIGVPLVTGAFRYFHGYVTRFAHTGFQGRMACYQLTLRPWLWFLTRAQQNRIFQQLNVTDVIRKVLQAYDVAAFRLLSEAALPVMDYCVQYRETDFDFVSRLMEENGFYYFFEHSETAHTLVITDSPSEFHSLDGYESVPFVPQGGLARDREGMQVWEASAEIQTGSWAATDFNYETPSAGLLSRSKIEADLDSHAGYEFFDYPGRHATEQEGRDRVRVRMESLYAQYARVQAQSNARGLGSGTLFALEQHPFSTYNVSYLVVSARYAITAGGYQTGDGGGMHYACELACVPASVTWRSACLTPRPIVYGPQTAIVVHGQSSSASDVMDAHGRIKVRFHWDQAGGNNEYKSCWIRVAQATAGNGWGHFFIPRPDQEVVVEFLDGNPDRPIVTGVVHNFEMNPPYAPNGVYTRSTIKSQTLSGNAWSEVRFDDAGGQEQLFIRAGRNRDSYVVQDDMQFVGGDRHMTVTGKQALKVGGRMSIDAAQDAQWQAGTAAALSAGTTLDIKAGTNVVIEAGATLTLVAGGSSIVLGASGITIDGARVAINGGGGGGAAKQASPDAPKAADDGTQ